MSEKPSIEACIYNSVEPECGVNSQNEAEALLAELTELRRAKWNWDEARAIVQGAAQRKAIFFGALDEWGQDLIALVLGDGDAEWSEKRHRGER